MNKIEKILSVLDKLKKENTLKIKGLNNIKHELDRIQRKNHKRIMASSSDNVSENLKQYLFNNKTLQRLEVVRDRIYDIKVENKTIENISSCIKNNFNVYIYSIIEVKLTLKERINILKDILLFTNNELHVKFVEDKVKTRTF